MFASCKVSLIANILADSRVRERSVPRILVVTFRASRPVPVLSPPADRRKDEALGLGKRAPSATRCRHIRGEW